MECKKGVLFMADVVNYTPQAHKHGSAKTDRFNQHYENEIRCLTDKHGGEFLKRSGDGVLVFFEKEEQFLEFVVELRELSQKRGLDVDDFFGDLRIVAHFGNFSFTDINGKISDVIGPEGIKVFRMEKYANAHDVLVTEFLLDMIQNTLKKKNIDSTKLDRVMLKGFDRETNLYKLIFPEEGEKGDANLLYREMDQLERDTKEIPVFGDLYAPMSMEDNFINLDVKSDIKEKKDLKDERYDEILPDVEDLMGIDGKRDRHHLKEKLKKQGPVFVDVKTLYNQHRKGIILGLPGSGKTTILKYFAYREFKRNHEEHEEHEEVRKEGKQRKVLFIECRNILSYNEWYHHRVSKNKKGGIVFNVVKVLNYLTHCFLFKAGKADGEKKELETAEKLVHQAYFNGCLTLLIDALDEAPGKEVKDKIIAGVKALFTDSTEGKKTNNRIYLTSRYSERERYFCGKHAKMLQPLFEVRPLDMEQLRQMAEYFYDGQPKLYKTFDEVVWQEEIAAKVGGTPLTALLVIAYFEIFKKFDTRYHMYNIIVIFILIRVWKQIKEKSFHKDMRIFFREAKSKKVLKEEKNARAVEREDSDSEEEEAEQWLEQMKEDHLLVSAGAELLRFLKNPVEQAGSEEMRTLFYQLALKSLAELKNLSTANIRENG